MSKISGCDVVRQLRKTLDVRDAVMVALTGIHHKHRLEALEAGFNLYLIKRVETEEIHTILRLLSI